MKFLRFWLWFNDSKCSNSDKYSLELVVVLQSEILVMWVGTFLTKLRLLELQSINLFRGHLVAGLGYDWRIVLIIKSYCLSMPHSNILRNLQS